MLSGVKRILQSNMVNFKIQRIKLIPIEHKKNTNSYFLSMAIRCIRKHIQVNFNIQLSMSPKLWVLATWLDIMF